MKNKGLRTITMLSVLLMLTAVSVCAQSRNKRAINIPFDFIVGQKTLPAGEYIVEPNHRDFDRVWLIQSRDGRTSALFTTKQVQTKETPEQAKLIFHKYAGQYFLSQVWTPGGNTGHELLMARTERELAKKAVKRETVALTIGGRK
jgi:hypothetical protein